MLISIYIQGNFNCKSSQPLDIFSRRTFQKKRLGWLLSLSSVTTEVPWSCLQKLEISLSKERKCELYLTHSGELVYLRLGDKLPYIDIAALTLRYWYLF